MLIYYVGQFADTRDSHGYLIPRAQKLRRFPPLSHTLRGAGQEDVAREQGHAEGEFRDQLRYREVHVLRIRVLLLHPVDVAPDPEVTRVWHLLSRHDPRPHRTALVHRLPLEPLSAMPPLDVAGRDVVSYRVTEHVLHRHFGGDAPPLTPYYDRELGLIVDLVGEGGIEGYVAAGAAHRGRRLGEKGRVLRQISFLVFTFATPLIEVR